MFTQTFVHNNEKYAVIEGTMSSIRTLNSKQNQLYIGLLSECSAIKLKNFWKKVFLINAELYLPENCRLTKPIMEKCI